LELEDVVELGMLDDIDSLTALVQTDHVDRVQQGRKPADRKPKKLTKAEEDKAEAEAFKNMLKDKDSFGKISGTMNKVVMACVLEPKILDPWIDDPNAVTEDNPTGRRKMDANERDPEAAYLDYINLVDKIGIFHEVFGGMEKLQQFREATDKSVGAVEDEPKPSHATSGSSSN
jgi:hypothetical protein